MLIICTEDINLKGLRLQAIFMLNQEHMFVNLTRLLKRFIFYVSVSHICGDPDDTMNLLGNPERFNHDNWDFWCFLHM